MNNTEYHYNIHQGTDEWAEIRAGRLGGTSCAALLVNGRSGNGLGKGAETLIYTKAAEYITGPEETYMSAAMERGTQLEPVARNRYSTETFQTVTEVGYISRGEYLGVSPDGLVGDDGGIEIKCPGGPEFVRFLDTRELSKDYYCQCQWSMYLTGRKWWDFVVFHPEFAPADIIIERQLPDLDMFAEWDKKVPIFIDEMNRLLEKIRMSREELVP